MSDALSPPAGPPARPESSLGHVPAGPRWAFDESVAAVFGDMLARSIPQLDVLRRACFDLGRRYVRPGTDVVDLGCADGAALADFVREFGAFNRHVGVEVSPPMLAAARERFACAIDRGGVVLRDDDLRDAYPPVRASLTLCVLTLQFVPVEHRLRLLSDAFRATVPGGALVLVEKVLGASAGLDAAFTSLYHGLKAENGYTPEEIRRKRLALEGVLVPLTARWNEEVLRASGFAEVDCFWRWMSFAGWIAVKPG